MSQGLRCDGCREMILEDGEPFFQLDRRIRNEDNHYYGVERGKMQHFHDLNCAFRWLVNNDRIPASWHPAIWHPQRDNDDE